MKRINLEKDIKPLSEFRANAASFVQTVRKTKRPLVITQHGRSSAVLLDVEEYEALIEKIELLQEVQLAEQQIKDNKSIDHDEVKNKIFKIIDR
ncbi:MAG: type II toxin-antitoxin system Phd/YefM family antitoxin [Calditrichia bacterium]|nr:type II toxin-antitoxin system Phd/YefM family antitoxin [Calditrichia bacterium]